MRQESIIECVDCIHRANIRDLCREEFGERMEHIPITIPDALYCRKLGMLIDEHDYCFLGTKGEKQPREEPPEMLTVKKRCPFCGGYAKVECITEQDGGTLYKAWRVICRKCGASTGHLPTGGYYGMRHTKSEAIELWDKRWEG